MNLVRMNLVLLCLVSVLAALPAWAEAPLRLGVIVFRPETQSMGQWQPLAAYLEKTLGRQVVVTNYTPPELDAAISQNAVDVVLTNPGQYTLLRHHHNLSAPLVTLVNQEAGDKFAAFGGVIFTRAEASIGALADLAGKSIAAISKDSLGAYQMQLFELQQAGVPLPKANRLLLTGMPQDLVVEAVLAGRADVGFVRTGVLETLARKGKLDLGRIKVINRQRLAFPYASSTRLYPEWPVSVTPQVDEQLARRLTIALLSLPSDSAAARAAGIDGFAVPADYKGIEELQRRLRLPPFDTPPEITLADLWEKYAAWITALGMLLLLLMGTGVGLAVQNRNVQLGQTRYRQQSQRLSEVIWGTNIGTWEWNVQTGETVFNERWAEIVGYTLAELEPVSIDTWTALAHPGDLKRSEALLDRCFSRADETYSCEARMRHKHGNWIWVLDRGRVVEWTAEGKPLRMSGTHQDITEQKEAEARLQLAASVFTHAREGIMITDAAGILVEVNDAFTRITGYPREQALGQNPRMLNSGRQPTEYFSAMWQALIEKGHWSGEIWNRRKNGEVFAEMLTISAVRDAAGQTQNYVALFTDITPMKEHQKQLEHIAHYDALTGLPNRMLLADRMRQAIAQSQRRERSLAVAYLDLDGFKAINDQHGHDVGDELLIAIAQRMKTALREGDTLARIGGDEFVAVLVDLDGAQDCEPVLARLLHAAAEPVTLHRQSLRVSASIGLTLYPQDGVDADLLLRHADQAMYQAKQAGKNRYHLFDIAQDAAVKIQRESLEHIRRALDRREFVLYYQPKVNMKTGEVIGAEALIRWQHPERGLLLPAAFLPIIETHPISVEMGEWVIDTALTQLSEWHALGLDIPVSVNIGARQLQQGDFVTRLSGLLAAHPEVKPCCLELEILETSALEDIAQVSELMHACGKLGVCFALDDFGTGYSSLTYLKRLPVKLLKIDQSFVRDMLDDPEDLAIVEGVVGLATAFRRQVIAEGVETSTHGELLLPLGCDLAQGYGIARPMPAAELPGWIATWRPCAAWMSWRERTPQRDELGIVFAEVEHRQWLRVLESYLSGNQEIPPPLDVHGCHFGRWRDKEGEERYGAHPDFVRLSSVHERVHTVSRELVDMHARGQRAEALARLGELHALRDELIERLRKLAGNVEKN